jgi:cytidylate kinase
LATLAPLAQIAAGASPVTSRPPNERSYVHATEQIIGHYADTGQAVILGRAATEILRDHPGVLRVRLDGSVQARTRQAMRIQGIDHDTAAHRRRQTDRARDDYLRHFYNADPHDASRYHLVLDTTAIDLDTCVQIIALAAESAPNAGAESTARDARTDHPTWRRPDAEQTDP